MVTPVEKNREYQARHRIKKRRTAVFEAYDRITLLIQDAFDGVDFIDPMLLPETFGAARYDAERTFGTPDELTPLAYAEKLLKRIATLRKLAVR